MNEIFEVIILSSCINTYEFQNNYLCNLLISNKKIREVDNINNFRKENNKNIIISIRVKMKKKTYSRGYLQVFEHSNVSNATYVTRMFIHLHILQIKKN